METVQPEIGEKLARLPDAPGVYQMIGEKGRVIYVGKAKRLKNRVRSYFAGTEKDVKTRRLVGAVRDIEWVVTPSEADALVLERTMVRKLKPRYNIDLKDDKSYPYVKVTYGDKYPWAFFVRRPKKDDRSLLFGPYVSALTLRDTLGVINKYFPIRKCNDRKFYGRTKPCLYYQIGRCAAPCTGEIDEVEHRKLVDEVVMFLKGDTANLIKKLEARMWSLAEEERYEEAAAVRDRIAGVRRLRRGDTSSSSRPIDADAWGVHREGELIAFCLIYVRGGEVQGQQTFHFNSELETEALGSSLLNQYYGGREAPDRVLTSVDLGDASLFEEVWSEARGKKTSVARPARGALRGWTKMAEANAKEHLDRIRAKEVNAQELLERLRKRLGLAEAPRRIECYDISNIMGTIAVGSRVVFIDGEPDKSLYRRYKIKTVEGANDFAMMKEVLGRRFGGSDRDDPHPNLLLIDGGKGQLNMALAAMGELGVEGVPTAGLAKARTESDFRGAEVQRSVERLFVPGRKNPILLQPNNAVTFLLERLRDESHRFAIEYHRKLRKRRDFASVLEDIPGIGVKRKKALLKRFGSLKKIKEADRQALLDSGVVNEAIADRILAAFRPADPADPRAGTS